MRFGSERNMEAEDVGFVTDGFEVGFLNKMIRIAGFLFIVCQNLSTKTFEPLCEGAAHIAVAQLGRLPVQVPGQCASGQWQR